MSKTMRIELPNTVESIIGGRKWQPFSLYLEQSRLLSVEWLNMLNERLQQEPGLLQSKFLPGVSRRIDIL